jgi:hypothetical protein
MEQFPPLVIRAQALAQQAGFALTREQAGPGRLSACLPGVGRFLAVLAAGCAGGQIGERGSLVTPGRTRAQDCRRSATQVNGWMMPAGVMCSSRSWLISSHLAPNCRASCHGL